MASQIVIGGEIIEVEERIEYTMNTGNIADMSVTKSNYTEAFRIPRLSLKALRTFEGLGTRISIIY